MKKQFPSPAQVVRSARAKGWSDDDIITNLMMGRIYKDRMAIAKVYAPAMKIELKDFMIKAGLKPLPR